ncbi:hypothetical protein O6H91_Y455100 [Diphasiastrum complanatum]|nr:hypothetical protein O6H91_Y455100 [Diphasiastrum complanatum]
MWIAMLVDNRKMQEKKTVCVPLSKGTGRPSGEGHSSDMWAWRKYGQKPIKGSPYPRGYYRCSSCKGCSAKKQVEISRNDPSMLIITYTSEHNHQAPRATTHNHFNPSPPASKQLHTTTEEKLNISEQEEATFAEAFQNPFCSIISSSAMHLDPVTIDAVITRREPSADMKMICSISNANCWSTTQDLEEFFAELEELPESSTIFERAVIDGKASDDEAIDGSVIIFRCMQEWSSSNSNVNSMVNT